MDVTRQRNNYKDVITGRFRIIVFLLLEMTIFSVNRPIKKKRAQIHVGRSSQKNRFQLVTTEIMYACRLFSALITCRPIPCIYVCLYYTDVDDRQLNPREINRRAIVPLSVNMVKKQFSTRLVIDFFPFIYIYTQSRLQTDYMQNVRLPCRSINSFAFSPP